MALGGEDPAAGFSGFEGVIVFQSRSGGNDDIYAMRAGREPVNLTGHAADDRRPSIAGARVFFESNRSGNWGLYAVELDGSGLRQVLVGEGQYKYPHVSPDGARVAFIASHETRMGLYTVAVDGTDLVMISDFEANRAGSYDRYPNWSPDGKRLIFDSNRDWDLKPTGAENFGAEIYVADAGGGVPLRLTDNQREDSLPAFSPDGARVVFNSARDGRFHIYSMDAGGGDVRQLTRGGHSNWSPHWRPDGARLVFVSNRDGQRLYLMDRDGGGQTPIPGTAGAGSPCWAAN